jgi:hypothetical protein
MDEHDVTARFEAEAILQRTRLIQQAASRWSKTRQFLSLVLMIGLVLFASLYFHDKQPQATFFPAFLVLIWVYGRNSATERALLSSSVTDYAA